MTEKNKLGKSTKRNLVTQVIALVIAFVIVIASHWQEGVTIAFVSASAFVAVFWTIVIRRERRRK